MLYKTFEDAIPTINKIIGLYRQKWTLSSYSYEDLSQDLRIRAYKKWHLFDPKKGSLEGWMARLTQNYIKNELRNKFYIYKSPCLRCEMFLGEDQCKLYGEVSTRCGLYAKFINQKENAANINFPVSYEQSEYDAKQTFSYGNHELVSEIYTQISGIQKDIFSLFYESGFSTTKIARTIRVSGFNFKSRVDFVDDSLSQTRETAAQIVENKKVSMGLFNG